jgi:hypothetical protein
MIPTLPADFLARGNQHSVIFGKTRMGKSMLLVATALAIGRNPLEGFTFSCPHGTARLVGEHFANPANGCSHRVLHVLDCNSSMVFGLNPFEVAEDTPTEWHNASLLWTSCVAAVYATALIATPRMETYMYALGFFASAKKITLLELLSAISLSGAAIREFLLAGIDNPAIIGVLTDLIELASRHPARFLEQLESCRNRLVRWLGDKRLARIFGKQKGLSARKIMDGRENVLFDPSALAEDDANFLSMILLCRYFIDAKHRPPNACAIHRLLIDEAAGSLSPLTSKFAAQAAKFGLLGIWGLQSKAQGDEKSEFIMDILVTNAANKVVFNTPEPEAARYLAEVCFNGPWLDLQEWKPASVRPVAVGNEKIIVRGRAHAEHDAQSQSSAETDMKSFARASAAVSAIMTSSGAAIGSGANSSFASMPDHVFEHGLPLSQTFGHNHSNAASTSRGNSRATSRAQQHSRGSARTQARAAIRGTSTAETENESFITRWENLPTQMFSLEEQWARLTGEIMNLPPREFFLKAEGQPPVRMRSPTVNPPFKSLAFRAEMLPRFLQSAAHRSPYLVNAEDVDAEITARLQTITTPPTKADDFEPAPVPSDSDIAARAQQLHRTFQAAAAKSSPLRIIPGGKDGDSK